jgi:hypothetical protein
MMVLEEEKKKKQKEERGEKDRKERPERQKNNKRKYDDPYAELSKEDAEKMGLNFR